MSRRKQPYLSKAFEPRSEHGGDKARGKRKTYRPLDRKRPVHLCMRSSRARGTWSLLARKNVDRVDDLVYRAAKRFDIRIRQYANVGNHLHLLISFRTADDFRAFLRLVSGQIAFVVTGARKGRPVARMGGALAGRAVESERFWDDLAYTRVVSWGRDYENARLYVIKNALEGAGAERYGPDGKEHPLIVLKCEKPPPDWEDLIADLDERGWPPVAV